MDSERGAKIKIIGEINTMLLFYDQDPIITEDFDLLYGLPLSELIDAKRHIRAKLRDTHPIIHRIH